MDDKQWMRDGVGASCVAVPMGLPAHMTVLSFLVQRFPHIDAAQWLERLQNGDVIDARSVAVLQAAWIASYAGQKLFYYRHVAHEKPIPFAAAMVYEDERIVVVDKPHFLPVMPGGQYVKETVLVRLRQQLQCPELTPVHRIDRETAGLVLLVKQAAWRGAYQALFRERQVDKQYEAVARWRPEKSFPLRHSSRLAEQGDFFRMGETQGEVNAITKVAVKEHNQHWARYVLTPITGKRHQLRVHMAALGMPLLNDAFYPEPRNITSDDYRQPLQLLAQTLAFTDPVTGQSQSFHSRQSLWRLEDVPAPE